MLSLEWATSEMMWSLQASRGVAVVVIPGDVSLLEVEDKLKPWPALHAPRTLPAEQDLQRLVEILQSSQKVTLLCGSGCAGAHDQGVRWCNPAVRDHAPRNRITRREAPPHI